MYLEVEKIIKDIFPLRVENDQDIPNILEKTSPLILGLSGGPDSMALFYILKKLQQKYAFYLVSAHLNHMFRGAEADKEEEILKQIAKKEKEILESLRIDVAKFAHDEKLSKQDAGHRLRQDFFKKLAKKYRGKHIALAHHGDDRVESFFIHLFHGSGAQGLSALAAVGDYGQGLKVIRPLMNFSKEEILDFCHKEKIVYFTDLSNEKPQYIRNKIRLQLVPLLEKEYNPNLKELILGSMEILEDENNYLEKVTKEKFKKLVKIQEQENSKSHQYLLDRKRFKKLDLALQRRLLIYILKKEDLNYNRQKISKILCLLKEEQGEQSYRLSQDWFLKIIYGTAYFLSEGDFSEGESVESLPLAPIIIPKITEAQAVTLIQGNLQFVFSLQEFYPEIKEETKKLIKEEILWLDPSLLDNKKNPLVLRPRQEGDMIKPLKGKRKRLKKYLIEKKVPSSQRDKLVILAKDQEVIWIPFLAFSHNYGFNKNKDKQSGKKMLKVVCKTKESLKNGH